MPHIHTQPNQHDITISSIIVLNEEGVWRCLVHFHHKLQVLMQIGGHVELDETPWQTVAHETNEESGYTLSELRLLQPTAEMLQSKINIIHPVPLIMGTYNVGDDHYHSDICYGFVAARRPAAAPTNGESSDLRWLTLDELKRMSSSGEVLSDVYTMYAFLLGHLDAYFQVEASSFSLEKPRESTVTYKTGRPRK